MLASAGRRYLLTLFNSSHNLLGQCQPGFAQSMATTSQALCQGSIDAEQPLQQQQQHGQQDQPLHSASQIQPLQTGPEAGDTDAEAAAAATPLASQQPMAAAMGPRKVNPAAFGGRHSPRAKREGIVHVNSTLNNTHLVLTDRDSKVETWVSGGTVGYKNANKASPMAAELAAKELARRALDKGFHSVVVKLKGMGKNKQFAVQSLAASGLTVTQLWDVTPIPYNGCRLPRRRRV